MSLSTQAIGYLDITNAILRVGTLDVAGIQGVDAVTNVLKGNSVLLWDDQGSDMASPPFQLGAGAARSTSPPEIDLRNASGSNFMYAGLKLPNAWLCKFDLYLADTSTGNVHVQTYTESTTTYGDDGYQLIFDGANNTVTLGNYNEANYLATRSSDFARMYEAQSADLSEFFANGGRLMLWHGESDPGPSPVGSNEYAQAVMAQNPAAADQFRYFTLTGVGHCAGGPGADMVDYLAAMHDWVSSGTAPERLIGTKADGSLTRPHCAWPNVARFEGEGDANDPESWNCTPRT